MTKQTVTKQRRVMFHRVAPREGDGRRFGVWLDAERGGAVRWVLHFYFLRARWVLVGYKPGLKWKTWEGT